MFSRPLHCQPLLCCVLLALTATTVSAQDKVMWRKDYNAARKEAEAKNLPMFIDFWKYNCPPCDKMDSTTFTDPRVVKMLNEQFIPLKINGPEEIQLSQSLQINAYPTTVLAGPDGKITNTLVGFQPPETLMDPLQRLLTSLAPQDKQGEKDMADARKWETAGDFGRAINILRTIIDDPRDRLIKKDARALMLKIEKRADDRMAQARDLQSQGKSAEALDVLAEVQRFYTGLNAARDAADLEKSIFQAKRDLKDLQRNKRVRELLAQAREFYNSKDYIPCVDRCEVIIANFGDLPEGQQAFALASEIKNNPEWMQNAIGVMIDRLGGLKLAKAEGHFKRNELTLMRAELESVVRMFPGTRMAESAQQRLSQIQSIIPDRKDPLSARP